MQKSRDKKCKESCAAGRCTGWDSETRGLGNELCANFNENSFKTVAVMVSRELYVKRKDKLFGCSSPLPSISTLSQNIPPLKK